MIIYSRILLFALLLLSATMLSSFISISTEEAWLIQSQSSLKVEGKTNINSFTCVIRSYGKSDTLIYKSGGAGLLRQIQLAGSMQIQIHNFDCYHKVMTKDLQKTLKADDHPVMHIRFISFSKNPSTIKSFEKISGNVEIELAGVKKYFEVQYTIYAKEQGKMELTGVRQILFSDFNLKPPSKLGGTIKVRNELDVEFVLHLTKLS